MRMSQYLHSLNSQIANKLGDIDEAFDTHYKFVLALSTLRSVVCVVAGRVMHSRRSSTVIACLEGKQRSWVALKLWFSLGIDNSIDSRHHSINWDSKST